MKIEQLLENTTNFSHGEIENFGDKIKNVIGLERFDLYLKKSGDIELAMIETHKDDRQAGKGTKAMKLLTDFADKHSFRIVLTPDVINGSGTTSVKRLTSFYKKFGFKDNKGRNKIYTINNAMYRDPR